MQVPDKHFVNGNALQGPFEKHLRQAVFALVVFGGQNAVSGRPTAFFRLRQGTAAERSRIQTTDPSVVAKRVTPKLCWLYLILLK